MVGVAVACESIAVVQTGALQQLQPLIDSGKTLTQSRCRLEWWIRWAQSTMYYVHTHTHHIL